MLGCDGSLIVTTRPRVRFYNDDSWRQGSSSQRWFWKGQRPDIRLVVLESVKITSLDGAKRFAWLIEVIYDAGISLPLSASGGINGLFEDIRIPEHLRLEMQRVRSRVIELASRES